MSNSTIGTITTIRRFPVKSMAGEVLQSTRIESYGLYGDRSHAFIDETKEGWSRYFTARNAAALLGYHASFDEAAVTDEAVADVDANADKFPPVTITAPDGRQLQWNEELLQEIQQIARPKLAMLEHTPSSPELAIDTASILLVTDKSVRKLEAMWSKPLDPLRFRANLFVTLSDEEGDESSWIGKRMTIGTAELRVDQYCERCSLITLDPQTQERDSSLLRKVNEEWNQNFGVYASVVKPGHVKVGDGVYWAE